MFKLINFLVKRPDLSLEQMKEHYESSHVPMALRTFPDILEHRRNYLPKNSAMAPPGVSLPEVDCIAELWFDDDAALQRAAASPEMKALHADGALFIGRIRSYVVEEKTIVG